MNDSLYEIKVNNTWLKVTYGVFRSWGGARKLNGHFYHGPVVTFGQGLPNPWTKEDENKLAEKEL